VLLSPLNRGLLFLQVPPFFHILFDSTFPLSRHIVKHSTPHLRPLTTSYRLLASEPSRHELNPSSSQNTRSGTDDEAAHSSAAFDPSTTKPETQKEQAKNEDKQTKSDDDNPLEVSGADEKARKGRPDTGRPVKTQEKEAQSAKGSPEKKGRTPGT